MESPSHSAMMEALSAENERLRERVQVAEARWHQDRQKLAGLEHELAQLKRLIFGTRSERFEPAARPGQGALFDEVPPAPEPSERRTSSRRPKRKPVRQALPAHLPREVIVIEPEVDPSVDPSTLKKIGEEVTETLDYRPARLVVLRRIRPKYVDLGDETSGVLIGELPARPIEKSLAEPSLLAHIVVEKFADHIPLYRQVQRFKREGIRLPTSTLEGWTAATAQLLVPLYERLREQVLASGYLQADETPIPVQDPKVKGKTHRGFYWVYHAPLQGLVVLDYQPGRGRDGPIAFLEGYRGALQSDGYTAYDAFEGRPEITLYGCWAHARRYFFEAKDNEPEWAEHALSEIGQLYAIERALREAGASADERQCQRQEEALPILARLRRWLEAHPGLPKSPWGKAAHYALARWDKLVRYTADGRIEIDDNLVENAIRPIALGRRNYLFAGSHEAARRAAVMYSLLATCKQHEINPQVWLSDVLGRIATHPQKQIDALLPHFWKHGEQESPGSGS